MFFTIGLPIILMLSCPVLLWVLAKAPFNIEQPGTRFKIMSILILIFWALVLPSFKINFCYWIAGFLLILAFLLFTFMLWSVLCWGYTFRMLLVLNERQDKVDNLCWQKLHAGPDGIQELTLNRIQALTRLGLAKFDGYHLTISGKGFYIAKAGRLFTLLFGVSL